MSARAFSTQCCGALPSARMVPPSSESETPGGGLRLAAMRLSTIAGFSAWYGSQWPTTRSGSRFDVRQQVGRIGGQRIAQARDVPLAIPALGAGDDDARFVRAGAWT